ncbi:pectinacetylesterase family protein [Striga asiatica]|uniref:Pectin acetylesterase n=1 Tax=Striga asiatica TaxID=4170 RepID=A0A5A7P2V3_STRAF|nr:pectinacetylesterase family protein [Striga asiatica]
MGDHLLRLVICLGFVLNGYQTNDESFDLNIVNLTLVSNAVEKGAVCNDGSSAAYYYDPGFDDGVNNWFVTLQGGGWCTSDETCTYRLTNGLGSSKYYNESVFFGEIKSTNQTVNPDFYNWNRIIVEYCDSSSFMGKSNHPKIISRGARIFYAVMEELLEKGMASAKNAILSGTSAGGLSAILHCDDFRVLLPFTSRVKCLVDSGFFIHAPKLLGAKRIEEYFANYGVATTKILSKVHRYCSSIGMFIHPCLRHGHFFQDSGWHASYKLRDKTIPEAVGDWFYDRSTRFQEIDNHKFPLSLNCTKLPTL